MNAQLTHRQGRVVVALGAEENIRLAIHAASAVASATKSELLCLIVEQEGLIDLARLPFAKAYGRGGVISTFNADTLRAHFDRKFRSAEKTLTEICAKANVVWRIQRPQGELFREITALLESGDVIVFDPNELEAASGSLTSTARQLLSVAAALVLPPQSARRGGPILAVQDGSGDAHAKKIAQSLADATGSGLNVLSERELKLVHGPIGIIVASVDSVEQIGETQFLSILANTGAMGVLASDQIV